MDAAVAAVAAPRRLAGHRAGGDRGQALGPVARASVEGLRGRGVELGAHQPAQVAWPDLADHIDVGAGERLADPRQLGEQHLGGAFRAAAYLPDGAAHPVRVDAHRDVRLVPGRGRAGVVDQVPVRVGVRRRLVAPFSPPFLERLAAVRDGALEPLQGGDVRALLAALREKRSPLGDPSLLGGPVGEDVVGPGDLQDHRPAVPQAETATGPLGPRASRTRRCCPRPGRSSRGTPRHRCNARGPPR